MTSFVTPPPLAPGDRVAVIAPSSGGAREAPHVFELGLERLRERFDLEPVVFPTARQSDEYLASSPRARAADIHAAVREPEIAGVIATIGGRDQLRVLKHLDPELVREHPTRVFGMSDNTNLELFLFTQGVVSYNGAQLMNGLAVPGELPAYTERYVRRAFFEETIGELEPARRWSDEPSTWWSNPEELSTPPSSEPNPGWEWYGPDEPVEGRFWGGTQAIVQWQLAADRFLPDPAVLEGAILGLETDETIPDPNAVATTITCLGERGLLARFDGVLVGRPPTRSHLTEPPRDERVAYREQLTATIVETIGRYAPDVPIVTGLDWGHTTPTAPLPIGGRIELDPEAERITCR